MLPGVPAEVAFAELVREKAEQGGGVLKLHRDLGFAENPMEREAEEVDVKVEEVASMQEVMLVCNTGVLH